MLKGQLDKRNRTNVAAWSKRNVVLTQTSLTYSNRVLWKTSVLPLVDVQEILERCVSVGTCCTGLHPSGRHAPLVALRVLIRPLVGIA